VDQVKETVKYCEKFRISWAI